ncbi:MAG: hypothetical protein ACI9E1_000615 [Cryomorphaceae bacterium]|jgi:hypothetical protein
MTSHRILFSLLAYLTCYTSLYAEPQEISVRSMMLGKKEMPELYFKTKSEEKLTPVNWSKRQPSKMVDALYEGTLPLFRMEVNEDGENIPVVAHRVKVPSGAKEILLFGWKHKDKINLLALGDNFLSAKHSDWFLINLSSKSIDFIVGRESKPIKVNSRQAIPYTIKVDEDKGAAILGKANIRNKDRIFYSSYIPVRSGRRTIIIFSDDGDKIRTTPVADLFSRRPKASE